MKFPTGGDVKRRKLLDSVRDPCSSKAPSLGEQPLPVDSV
ncbi:hypothetical protein ACVLD2_000901 [Paenibacillus sp. PvR052]